MTGHLAGALCECSRQGTGAVAHHVVDELVPQQPHATGRLMSRRPAGQPASGALVSLRRAARRGQRPAAGGQRH
jgi:hypothetical protein